MKELFVFTDGGARGNPGPAAIGVVIKYKIANSKYKIVKFGKRIGETTNNVAEYMAVIKALQWVINNLATKQFSDETISFFLDSKLVVNQLNGLFKIKDANLRELLLKIRELEGEVGGYISYQLIPREKNNLADSLVKQSLDY